MDGEIATAVVGAEKSPTGVDSISASEFALRRSAPVEEPVSEPEAKDEIEEPELPLEGEPVAEEATEEPEESEEESEDVLSQFNLDSLSKEEKANLREALIPGAQKRIKDLVARSKNSEEENDRLRQSLSEKQDPLKVEPDAANNPFNDISTIQDLQSKAKEVSEIVEWAEDILDESDDYMSDDEVTKIDGNPMTKREVRAALKNARKSRDKFLPSRLRELRKAEIASKTKQELGKRALEQFPWLSEEKSEIRQKYIELAGSELMKKAYSVDKEAEAQLPYILAQAVDNMYGRKEVTGDKPIARVKPRTITPNSVPATSSSPSEKTERGSTKVIKELGDRFKKSGQKDDFVKFRTEQLKGNR